MTNRSEFHCYRRIRTVLKHSCIAWCVC